ncbi:MAG: dihydropteroate synthase [Candidatus Bipolaricaulota bacterium]|nr:dihydropteroate synthase [Candidatus Bipolaricaulota bacterium]
MEERERVLVMGVINVTPDSFYAGGRYDTAAPAIEHGLRLCKEGADIIDIGGESSRPGAAPVSINEEIERVLPVIAGIHKRSDVLISIDTTRAKVAREAITAGASIVNDISALRFDEKLARVIAENGAWVVLMHMQGTPETMQQAPRYTDPVREIKDFLGERIAAATAAGISPSRIIIDPGIGFGKKLEHNLAILREINSLTTLGPPVLIGLSRKSFLGEILGLPAKSRLEGTIAANAIAVANGVDIIRVHDVKEGKRTVEVARRLRDHAI